MLTAWFDLENPFSLMDDFRARLDALFDELERGGSWAGRSGFWPRANLYDLGNSLAVQLVLPGVSKDDIEISATQDQLTITGERKDDMPEGVTVHRQERRPFRFSRSFSFPVKVEAEKAKAELKNGILTVTVPKAPELQPRKIEVKVG